MVFYLAKGICESNLFFQKIYIVWKKPTGLFDFNQKEDWFEPNVAKKPCLFDLGTLKYPFFVVLIQTWEETCSLHKDILDLEKKFLTEISQILLFPCKV